MAKAVPRVSYVIVDGKKRAIVHTQHNDSQHVKLSNDQKKLISEILKHEVIKKLDGQEKVDAVLGELVEAEIINETMYQNLLGMKIKIDSANDVVKLVEKESN